MRLFPRTDPASESTAAVRHRAWGVLAASLTLAAVVLSACTGNEEAPSTSTKESATGTSPSTSSASPGGPTEQSTKVLSYTPNLTPIATMTGDDGVKLNIVSIHAGTTATLITGWWQAPTVKAYSNFSAGRLTLTDTAHHLEYTEARWSPIRGLSVNDALNQFWKARPTGEEVTFMFPPLRPGTTSVTTAMKGFTPVTLPVNRTGTATTPTGTTTPSSPATTPTSTRTGMPKQLSVLGTQEEGVPLVLTLHHVVRTKDATLVYVSGGVPAPETGRTKTALSSGIGSSLASFQNDRSPQASGPQVRYCDVGVMDTTHATMYTRLSDLTCGGTLQRAEVEAGRAYTFVAATPPLPAGIDTVAVTIHGHIFTDIPVETTTPTPTLPAVTATSSFDANKAAPPTELGTGWPSINPTTITAANPTDATFPMKLDITDQTTQVTTNGATVRVAADVLFASDSATITTKGTTSITAAATEIKTHSTGGKITITGHTDNTNTNTYNHALSIKRATAVATQLTTHLGTSYTITTTGKGETQPIDTNTTTQGRAHNRRVDITYTPTK